MGTAADRTIGLNQAQVAYRPGQDVVVGIASSPNPSEYEFSADDARFLQSVLTTELFPYVNFVWSVNIAPVAQLRKAHVRIVRNPKSNVSFTTPVGGKPALLELGVVDKSILIHEMLHALGAMHEAQNPTGNLLNFKIRETDEYFKRLEFTPSMIKQFVYARMPPSPQYMRTPFDPESVMMYNFPSEIMVSGVGYVMGSKLSEGDKLWLASMYGPTPANPLVAKPDHAGVLRK